MKHSVVGRKGFLFIRLKYIIAFLLVFILDVFPTQAQDANFWSTQEKIPDYEIYNNEQPPYLIADRNHKVHAFNSQFLGEDDTPDAHKAIFYRQWTPLNGWTYPNDILADENGTLNVVGVSSDETGKVHMVFQNASADLYYTQAYLANASDPNGWSDPLLIGSQSHPVIFGVPNVVAISSDDAGEKIVVVYSGSQYGNGLYFVYSADAGNTWSVPYPIYLTGDETMIVVNPSLYMSESGILHVVWSTFDSRGFGGPGYYARFDSNTGKWSEPVPLDQEGIRTPSVIEYKDDLFIAYYHHSTNSRWWRYSRDGGETWSTPAKIGPSQVGTNGGVSFVVDSNETLHAFFGGRTDRNGMHGIWHSIWSGNGWSSPSAVVMGKSRQDVDGGNGYDPTFARAVVSNGNLMLVTWGTDGGVGTNGAWYSYTRLDAPELPSIDMQGPTATSTPLVVSTMTPTQSQDQPSVNDDNLFDNSSGSRQGPQTSTFLSVAPVFLFLAGLLLIFYILQHKK